MSNRKRATLAVALIVAVALGVIAFQAIGSSPSDALAPDVVYHSGKIATVNANFDMVQAVAVRQGRIVAVGSTETVRALASGTTRLVDLQGKTVLPGFYDNHVHLYGTGTAEGPVPHHVDQFLARSLNEVLAAIRRKTGEVPKGEWIQVTLPWTVGYPHPFPQDKLPTRWDLDKAAPDHPVYVTRGHASIVNTLGLQRAGITTNTVVTGGVLVKDAKGELTGQLREGPVRRLITQLLPPTPSLDLETANAKLRRYLEALLAVGITSANVIGPPADVGGSWSLRRLQDFYALEGEKLPRFTVQRRLSPGYDGSDNLKTAVAATIRELEAIPFRTGFGNERLKVGAIKMSIDGAFSGPSAWILEPYRDPGYQGAVRLPEEALYPVAKRAHELGWQLGIHAIGDAAVQMTVNVLERILQESPRADHRHYLHHVAARPPEETVKKMARLGIIVASQPNWVYTKTQFLAAALGGERLETQNPTKSLMDRGVRVSYGSDDDPHGPFVGLYSAVTRKSVDGKVYGPGERVSLEQAIRNYTVETAYMNFEEQDKGSLEAGKFADMIVLAEDIFTVDPERIKDIGVEKAIVGGEVVYSTTRPMRPWMLPQYPWPLEPATTSSGQP